MHQDPIPLEEAIARVAAIDLGPVMWKLNQNGMSDADIIEGVEQYRRFLVMQLLHPEKTIVPTELMDRVWHTHILDTAQYAADCEQLFGGFLHHFPYSGWQGGEMAERHAMAFQETKRLYEHLFGPLGSDATAALCPKGYCDDDFRPTEQRPSYMPAHG